MTPREREARTSFERRTHELAVLVFNTLVLFAIANVGAWYALGPVSAPEAGLHPRRKAIAKFGIETFRRVYPGRSDDQIRQILDDHSMLSNAYEPFAEFRSTAISKPTLAIHSAGFRLNGEQQGPWPLDDEAINVFVFGGSTAIGGGVPDDETIPAALQAILRERQPSGGPALNVYNFGVGAYFSSQEVTWYQNQLRHGRVPDIAVFVDGLNDFFFWDGEPATAQRSRRLDDVIRDLNQRLGREHGIGWHTVEWIAALPLARLVRSAVAQPNDSHDRADPPRVGALPATPSSEGLDSDALYARSYEDGDEITDPVRIQAVISRYLVNKAIVEGISKQLGIEPILAWQPVPHYEYPLALHPFPIMDGHRRSRYGYPAFAQYVATHDLGKHFAWCADVLRDATRPQYVDQVHYNAEGSRRVAACIAERILASGALDRARDRKLGQARRIGPAESLPAPVPPGLRVEGTLFGPQAVPAGLSMSQPLDTWGQLGPEGVRLADESDAYAVIVQDLPLAPPPEDRTYWISVRIKAATSTYFGLVVSCIGAPAAESSALSLDPATMGLLSVSGFHELAHEQGDWVRLTLQRSCADPAHQVLRVSLYPMHGQPEARGAILFGGGEVARAAVSNRDDGQ